MEPSVSSQSILTEEILLKNAVKRLGVACSPLRHRGIALTQQAGWWWWRWGGSEVGWKTERKHGKRREGTHWCGQERGRAHPQYVHGKTERIEQRKTRFAFPEGNSRAWKEEKKIVRVEYYYYYFLTVKVKVIIK